MPYRIVLNLIDAELERLIAARRLLLDEPEQVRTVSAAAPAAEPAAPESTKAPEPVKPEVVVQKFAARVPRQTSGVRRRRNPAGQAAEAGALSGSIPSAPVVVSAAKVSETAHRETASREEAAKPEVPAGEGTLEALLKDLRSRGSAA